MSSKRLAYIVVAAGVSIAFVGSLFLTAENDAPKVNISPSVRVTSIESKPPFLEIPAPSVSSSVPPLPTAPACPSGPEECPFN